MAWGFVTLIIVGVPLALLIAWIIKRLSDKDEQRVARYLTSRAREGASAGDFILTPSRAPLALIVGLALGMVASAASLISALVQDEPSMFELALDSANTVLLGALALILLAGRVEFHVSRLGIERTGRFTRSLSIEWARVESVTMDRSGSAFVIRSGKRKMLVPLRCSGLHDFSELVMSNVPPDRHVGADQYLMQSLGIGAFPGLTF